MNLSLSPERRRTRGSVVRIRTYSSHGHTDFGTGILLTRRPVRILTAAHVLASFEGDTAPALSIDGHPHQLRRIIRFPGLQEDLLAVLETAGPLAAGKKPVKLPRSPVPLMEGQTVSVEREESGISTTYEASVTTLIHDGDEEAVVLNLPGTQGDSGSPVFVRSTLVGVCQASGGGGSGGASIVSPLSEEALGLLHRLVRQMHVLRWIALLTPLALVSAVAVIALPTWLHGGNPVFPKIEIWVEDPKFQYSYQPGDVIPLVFQLNKAATVSLVEQLPDGTEKRLIDKEFAAPGRKPFSAIAETVAGEVTYEMTAEALGKHSSSSVSVRVGPKYVPPPGPNEPATNAALADPQLEKAVRAAIGKTEGEVTQAELAGVRNLPARGYGVTDLSGIDACVNLLVLDLGENKLTDLRPLASLTELRQLKLDRNGTIRDIAPLQGLTKLEALDITYNGISDLSALQNLTDLKWLFLGGNEMKSHSLAALRRLVQLRVLHAWGAALTDISAVSAMRLLQELHVENNAIVDVSGVSSLSNLTSLNISGNRIRDISPLLRNPGIGLADYVDLRENQVALSPSSSQSAAILDLQKRGVNLLVLPQQ